MPDQGEHVLADSVLRGHHRGVLRGAAVRAGGAVHGDRCAPDGRPGHQLHGQRVQPARAPPGGSHAGHRRAVLLRVPTPVPRVHHVDHPGARTRVPRPRAQALLHHIVRQPHDGLPKLGRQPHPVQPHVVQVPPRLLQAGAVPVRRPLCRPRCRRLRRRPGSRHGRWPPSTSRTPPPPRRVPAPARRHADDHAVRVVQRPADRRRRRREQRLRGGTSPPSGRRRHCSARRPSPSQNASRRRPIRLVRRPAEGEFCVTRMQFRTNCRFFLLISTVIRLLSFNHIVYTIQCSGLSRTRSFWYFVIKSAWLA